MGYTMKRVSISKMEHVKVGRILEGGNDLTKYVNERDKTNLSPEQLKGIKANAYNECLDLFYEVPVVVL